MPILNDAGNIMMGDVQVLKAMHMGQQVWPPAATGPNRNTWKVGYYRTDPLVGYLSIAEGSFADSSMLYLHAEGWYNTPSSDFWDAIQAGGSLLLHSPQYGGEVLLTAMGPAVRVATHYEVPTAYVSGPNFMTNEVVTVTYTGP